VAPTRSLPGAADLRAALASGQLRVASDMIVRSSSPGAQHVAQPQERLGYHEAPQLQQSAGLRHGARRDLDHQVERAVEVTWFPGC
jgi:hypothetical protein